jgi:SAM-dependent methyltransferase
MSSAADDIVGLYQRHSAAWIAARGDTLLERTWIDRFVHLLPKRASVLDMGCGSGVPIARHLADRGLSVFGVDSSPDMVARFEENLPSEAARVTDMRSLDLGCRFDGLLAWDSFFHLKHDDQRAMFPIFRTHAGPGAALMFTSGPGHGEAMGSFQGEPLYHASLAPNEYRRLLFDNGFEVVAHVSEDPDCGNHTVWLALAN